MSVDISRAKRVAWVTWDGIIVLASREGPQESFKSENTGNIYPQSQVEEFLGARAIEEFPLSPLEEAIGDAPAFQQTHHDFFNLVWVRRNNGKWGAVNVNSWKSNKSIPGRIAQDYTMEELEAFIHPSEVVRLYPD